MFTLASCSSSSLAQQPPNSNTDNNEMEEEEGESEQLGDIPHIPAVEDVKQGS